MAKSGIYSFFSSHNAIQTIIVPKHIINFILYDYINIWIHFGGNTMNKLETMMSRIKLMSNIIAHTYLKEWCFTGKNEENG